MADWAIQVLVTLVAVMGYQALMHCRGHELTRQHGMWTYWLMGYVGSVIFLTRRCAFVALAAPAMALHPLLGQALVLLGQLLLLAPLGFFLPHIWHYLDSAPEVVLVGYAFSLVLALCQLPWHQTLDIETVLVQSLGTFVGYLFWRNVGRYAFYGRASLRTMALGRAEPFVYLGLALGCGLALGGWPMLF